MYAVTSMPLVSRTRQTLRRAEFGFFGVVVYTRVHTPRFCGAATFFLRPLPDLRPGVASFLVFGWRPLRTSWEVVGMRPGRIAVAFGAPGSLTAAPWPAEPPSVHRQGSPSGGGRHQLERLQRRRVLQALV